MLGISSLLQSLANPHGDFFQSGETFPIGKLNSYRTSNLGKKSLWQVKPYIMDNIGINPPYQTSIWLLVLILYREVDYSHSYSQCHNISEKTLKNTQLKIIFTIHNTFNRLVRGCFSYIFVLFVTFF